MSEQTEEELKKKAQKISIFEGSGYSVMDGFGLRYISPFAVALGATNLVIGLISSLPHLIASFCQILGIKAMNKHPRKKIILFSVFLQTLMWLPIILVGAAYFIFEVSSINLSILLLIFYTLMAISGSLATPNWNSWMRDIVPKDAGAYFGKRSGIIGFVAMLSMLIAGFILDHFKNSGKVLIGFSIIFAIAALGRSISGIFFIKQYEPKFKQDKSFYFTFRQFLKRMPENNFGHFVLLTGLMMFATAIASPFFAVYMLKDLGFENWYLGYTLVAIAPVISALLVTKYWGRFIDKYGNIITLRINGILISLVPINWIIIHFIKDKLGNSLIFYLFMIEAYSGVIWAGFNLAAAVFVYHAVTKQRMALCVTYNNIINSTLLFLGSIAGGYLATQGLFSIHSLIFVFAISAFLRLIVALLITKFVREVSPVKKLSFKEIKDFLNRISPLHLFNLGIKRVGLSTALNSE